MDVTSEQISLYVDGRLSGQEAEAVRQALEADEALRGEYEDLQALEELFGNVEPETVSDSLRDRLYDLRPVPVLDAFEPVAVAPVRRVRWFTWAAAAAALVLAAFGLRVLTFKPEVVLRDFTRLSLDAAGRVAEPAHTFCELRRRTGEVLRTDGQERLSFRTEEGALVVLQPGTTIELGDPRERQLFELLDGTVLCTVPESRDGEARAVLAGGFTLYARRAHFGVRVEGLDARAAGPAGGRWPRVTVVVSRGSLEVGSNGERERVAEYEGIQLERGTPGRRSHAASDPMFFELMRRFRRHSTEVLPGYFSGENGVVVIGRSRWQRQGRARVLVVSDGGEEAARSSHLVLKVRARRPTALRITQLTPYADAPGLVRARTVTVGEVGPEAAILAVPLDAFAGPDAEQEDRAVPASRSRLMRLELAAADPKIEIDVLTSLWADRPPAGDSEVVR